VLSILINSNLKTNDKLFTKFHGIKYDIFPFGSFVKDLQCL
jgi:hypothetical protein